MSQAKAIQAGLFRCQECGHDHAKSKRGRYKSNVKYRCGRICRECMTLHQRDYRRRNKDACNKRTRLWMAGIRDEMFAAYGSECECCGEANRAFLTLEHRRGDGAKDRRGKRNNDDLIRVLRQQGWPKADYGILCYNCNIGSYRNGGLCPHGNYKNLKWDSSIESLSA